MHLQSTVQEGFTKRGCLIILNPAVDTKLSIKTKYTELQFFDIGTKKNICIYIGTPTSCNDGWGITGRTLMATVTVVCYSEDYTSRTLQIAKPMLNNLPSSFQDASCTGQVT